jgi:hypothetical protein
MNSSTTSDVKVDFFGGMLGLVLCSGILATIYCVELSSGVEKYFNSIFLPSL